MVFLKDHFLIICREIHARYYARPNADLFIPPFLGLFQPFPNFYTLL